MATPIPLSGADCHIYISHHGRVVMLLEKMWLHNHKWCGLGFYSSCCILFLTLEKSQVTKSTSTWSPHGVHLESMWSLLGVHMESTGNMGLQVEFTATCGGVSLTATVTVTCLAKICICQLAEWPVTRSEFCQLGVTGNWRTTERTMAIYHPQQWQSL